MLVIMAVGGDEEQLANIINRMYSHIRENYKTVRHLSIIGPSEPALSKIKDMYRRVIYIKHQDYQILVDVKDCVESWLRYNENEKTDRVGKINDNMLSGVNVFFDFNPMNMY